MGWAANIFGLQMGNQYHLARMWNQVQVSIFQKPGIKTTNSESFLSVYPEKADL